VIKFRHARAGGNPERKLEETVLPDKFLCGQVWIPACAGMTAKIFLFEIYYKRSSENRFSGFQTTSAFFLRLIF